METAIHPAGPSPFHNPPTVPDQLLGEQSDEESGSRWSELSVGTIRLQRAQLSRPRRLSSDPDSFASYKAVSPTVSVEEEDVSESDMDDMDVYELDSEPSLVDWREGYSYANIEDEARIHIEFGGGSDADVESNEVTELDLPGYASYDEGESDVDSDLLDDETDSKPPSGFWAELRYADSEDEARIEAEFEGVNESGNDSEADIPAPKSESRAKDGVADDLPDYESEAEYSPPSPAPVEYPRQAQGMTEEEENDALTHLSIFQDLGIDYRNVTNEYVS